MFLLCTTFALALGLFFFKSNIVISILISLTFLIFVLFRFGKRKFVIVILLFASGVVIPKIPIKANPGPTYVGYVIDARDNYYIFQSKFEKYYVYLEDNDLEIGDKLVLKGEVKPFKSTSYESQFDFRKYLENKGITEELNVKAIESKRQSLIRIHHFKRKFLNKFDENTSTLISAFLFNDKDYSSNSIRIANNNSVLFLFSLSGIYLHLLFAIAEYLYLIKFSKSL